MRLCRGLANTEVDAHSQLLDGSQGALQKYGFLREEALLLTKSKPMSYIIMEDNNIKIDPQICNAVSKNLQSSIETIKINYPEIFTSCIG